MPRQFTIAASVLIISVTCSRSPAIQAWQNLSAESIEFFSFNDLVAIADRATDISAARLSILAVLKYGGSQTIGSLSRIEGVKPPTISNLINALEGEGLVIREANEGDARQSLVSAT